jgi:hypothetical protein
MNDAAGYSGTPLVRKLGFKAGMKAAILGAPDGFDDILGKKAAKMDTNITEDVVREVVLPAGLVDVKVCAIDATWSGLKIVIRKELR